VNRVYGTVDRVHGRDSPRSTCLIKPWLSALGSTTRIKSIEGVSACLIVTVGSGSDGGETAVRESGGALGPRRWRYGTPVSFWFSAYGAPNRVPFLPTTLHWQKELDPQTFRWQWSTGTSGSGKFPPSSTGDGERRLWRSSGFKK
jgi:hypothetical protein